MNKKIIITLFSLLVGLSVFVTSCIETSGGTPDGNGETPAAPNFELTLDSASDTSFTFEGDVINNKEDTEIEGKKVVLKVTDKNADSGATQTPVYAFLPTTPFTTVVENDADIANVIVAGTAHVMEATATLITADEIPYPGDNTSNVQITCNVLNEPTGIVAANLRISCTNAGNTLLDSATFSDEAMKTAARAAVTQNSATFKIAKFASATAYSTVAGEFATAIGALTKITDVVDYVNGLEEVYADKADISEVTVTATSTLSFTSDGTPAAPDFELTLDGSASDTSFTFEGGIINNKEDTEIEGKKVVLKVTDKNAGSGATQTPVYKFLPTTPFTTDVEDDVANVIVAGTAHVMEATATLITAANILYPTENGLPNYANVQLTCNGYNAEAGISAANLRINCTNAGNTLLESTVFSDETKKTVARNAVTQSAATFKIVRFPSAARHNEISALITENIAALETISDLVTYVNGLEQAYAAYSDVDTSEVTVTATSTLSFTPDGTPAAPNFELTLDGSASDTSFTFEGGVINNKEDTEIEGKKVVLKVTDKNPGSDATQTPVYKFLPTTPFTTDVEDDAEVGNVLYAAALPHIKDITATLITAANIPYPAENGLPNNSNVQLACSITNPPYGITAENIKIDCDNFGSTLLDSATFSDETKKATARNAVTQSAATFKIVRFPSAARHNEISDFLTVKVAALRTISDLVAYVNGLEQAYAAYSDVVTSEVTVTATSTLSFTSGGTK